MNTPKAIIFDLDDTLILSDGTVEQTWTEACLEYSKKNPSVNPEQLWEKIRDAAIWYWTDEERHRQGRLNMDQTRRDLVIRAFTKLGIGDSQGAVELVDRYSKRRYEVIELFPNSIDTLKNVRGMGIKTGLLTNGESLMQRTKINKFQLKPYFDVIQIEGEKGCGKPEIQSYLSILDSLSVKSQDAWIVGDNLEWEVVVPQTLGLLAIWHNYYGKEITDPTIKPDRIITEISQVCNVLEETLCN